MKRPLSSANSLQHEFRLGAGQEENHPLFVASRGILRRRSEVLLPIMVWSIPLKWGKVEKSRQRRSAKPASFHFFLGNDLARPSGGTLHFHALHQKFEGGMKDLFKQFFPAISRP